MSVSKLEGLLAEHRKCLDRQLSDSRQYVAAEVTSNASGKHGLLDTRQKVRLCRDFSRGRHSCPRGSAGFNDTSKCTFSHGPLDIWNRLTLSNEVQDGACSRPKWALNDPDWLWWLLKHFSLTNAERQRLFELIIENLAGRLDQGTCPICYEDLEEHLSLCFHDDARPGQPQYHHRVCKATCAELFLESSDRQGECLCPFCRAHINNAYLRHQLQLFETEDLIENHKSLWPCLRSAAKTFIVIWNVEDQISKLRSSKEVKMEKSRQAKATRSLEAKLALMQPQQFTLPVPTPRTTSESRTSHATPRKLLTVPHPPHTKQKKDQAPDDSSAASSSSQRRYERNEDSSTTGSSRGNADSRSSSEGMKSMATPSSLTDTTDGGIRYQRNFLLAIKQVQKLTSIPVPPGLALQLVARSSTGINSPPSSASQNAAVEEGQNIAHTSSNITPGNHSADPETSSCSSEATAAAVQPPPVLSDQHDVSTAFEATGESMADTSSSIIESAAAAAHTADILQSSTVVPAPPGLSESLPPAAKVSGAACMQVIFGMACRPNERFQTACNADTEALTQLLEDLRSHPMLDSNGTIKCLDLDGKQWFSVSTAEDLLPHITNGKLELRCHRLIDAAQVVDEFKQLRLQLSDALDLAQASPRTLIGATLKQMFGGVYEVPLGLSMLEQLEWAHHLVLG
jgi:hypothetical protein